ncbi:MAG TPA: DUF3667 domain-containing protein [Pyrinomonadaceae bacterium]|nr:DUF3667 domain-containing protein [Acidobacteriota bacterium]HQZ96885.1 DUF3667 domain-containing protein [Pyrinomonadaceae bacterium]
MEKQVPEIVEPEISEEPTLSSLEPVACLNCGHESAGDFCNMCGQAADVERYSLSSFLRELYNNLRKIEISTTFATAIELLRRPGDFVKEYLAGKRVGYINPIKFYFYAMIADVLVRGLFLWLTGDQAFASPLTGNTMYQIEGLLSTIFWGLLWKVFYRSSKFNVIEFAVCAVYFEAETDLFATTLMVITAPLRNSMPYIPTVLTSVDLLLTAAYGIYFARQIFEEPLPKTIIKQTMLMILFIILLVTTLFVPNQLH